MKQHYPLDPASGIENAALAWQNGNPATGTNGSFPPFGLFVDPQAEILAAQRAGGLIDSADGSDTAQLAQGISRGTWLGTIGQPGSANDLVTALPGSIIWPKLLIGMEFSGVINAANTGPLTVTMTGFGTLPGKLNLVGRSGAALAAGDIPANIPFKFRYDGTAYRLASGSGSDTVATLASSNARLRLKQQNVISDLSYDANANNNYQAYASTATDLGTFTIPAGYVCILLEAAAFINGGSAGTGVYLAVFSNANDGSGWIFQESQQVYKPSGQIVTISRPSLLSLDPTKSYTFSCRMLKDSQTTTATSVSGNLLGLAFKF